MSLLFSVSSIEKTMGSNLLFKDLSFAVSANDKLALIGRNGTGKSTLLRLIAGVDQPDSGEISLRRGLVLSFVEQDEKFDEELTATEVVSQYLNEKTQLDESETMIQAGIALSQVGFEDLAVKCGSLSGGWRKRLSIAKSIAIEPELLILDEPTNHLDWEGILWLEGWLGKFHGAILLVSHDRQFLNNCCKKTLEISPMYPDGYKLWDRSYYAFVDSRAEWMQQQMEQEKRMANRMRREIEWLRAGVKARTTKSRSRIDQAHELIDQHSALKGRNQAGSQRATIEIDKAGKKSKRFIELTEVSISYAETPIISQINLKLGPKMCCAVLGDNGSGKSSLLNIIGRRAQNYSGDIFWANDLKIVYFEQKREDLPLDQSLMDFLGEGTEYVYFRGQSVHVAGYASRFLFPSEKMRLEIGRLSGGEQARLLIAKLLLQPADILIMDEPTNDLDIESIEILESSLIDFEGLTLIVSHDRKFIQQISTHYLALEGTAQAYADLGQWLKTRRGKSTINSISEKRGKQKQKPKKLSYKDKRRLETIEEEILLDEEQLQVFEAQLTDERILADHSQLLSLTKNIENQKTKIESLYAEWSRLESLLKND